MRHPLLLALAVTFIALTIAACGGSSHPRGGVTIEPLATATAQPAGAFAGKPAAPPATAPPAAPVETATEPPASAATDVPATEIAAAAAASPTPSLAPTSGRWIDVDVTRFVVRLQKCGLFVSRT